MNPKSLSIGTLVLALASGTCAAQRAVVQEEGAHPLVVRQSGPMFYVTGDCSGESRPDRAVIAGAMTAEAVKPVDAQEQLDRQLAELTKYVDAQQGQVQLLERVRAARTLRETSGRSSRNETLPFLAMQRLEVEFPASADIDAIFERLLYFGLDRFGPNIRVDRVDRRRHIAVRYRFSALRKELDRIYETCRAEAFTRWCANEGNGYAVCTLPDQERDARVKTRSLNLKTQRLLNDRGNTSHYYLNYPWRSEQMAQVEPVGNVAVEFHGTIQLQITDVQP